MPPRVLNSRGAIAMQKNSGRTMEESPFKGKTGLRRLMNAFGYSVHGFASAFRHEDAFRQEVLLAAAISWWRSCSTSAELARR